MKLTHLFAAATMIAGLGVSTAASAQDYRHDDRRYEQRDQRGYDHRGDRRDYRGDGRRSYGNDRGRHYGWGRHGRRCHSEWRHHRRVTVCYR